MKPGERPPKIVKAMVVDLGGRLLRPTNAKIIEAVKQEFSLDISDRTIYRYCKKAGVPTSVRRQRSAGAVYVTRSKLKIEPLGQSNTRSRHYVEGAVRMVTQLQIRNAGAVEAKGVQGILQVIGTGVPNVQREYKLHWAGADYTLEDETAEPVDILPQTTRPIDVCFTIQSPDDLNLRTVSGKDIAEAPIYSGKTYAGTSSMGKPILLTGSTTAAEKGGGHRSLAAADREARSNMGGAGCWIAIPLALSRPDMAYQAYLPPGEYTIRVRVMCPGGEGSRRTYRLVSPQTPDGLRLEETST
ncbi:MAG: hypothetical protein WC749_02980 [Dehalococcoidia bacterium]